jgi:phospholipase C
MLRPPRNEMPEKGQNPYLGPRPFIEEDRFRFFGRKREAAELCSLVVAHRTVLLYSQSGAGKTSLLNAGVVPQLQARGFDVLPTARVSGAADESIESGIENIFVFNCKRFWGDGTAANATLSAVLASRPREVSTSGELSPRIIVFDQFEELFTAYPDRWAERAKFFQQLDDAMTDDRSLRVLFAMREEFVAYLDPYEDLLPEELRTRYRLEQLREDAALAAVEQPLQGTGIVFEDGVAGLLVRDLLKTTPKTSPIVRTPQIAAQERPAYVLAEFVDPVQLQVVCFNLFRKLPPGAAEITEEHLTKYGNIDQALSDFYIESLTEAAKKSHVEEGSLRQWFESALITESDTRGLVFRGDKTAGGISNSAVDVLEELHIIRPEVRGGDRWYELSHDRFIKPILRANDSWRQSKSAKRLRKWLTVLSVASGLLIAAAIVYVFELRQLKAKQRDTIAGLTAQNAKLEAKNKGLIFTSNHFNEILRGIRQVDNANPTQPTGKTKGTISDQPLPSLAAPPRQIKHVIVLMLENRSFDHMLGALKSINPDVEGLAGNETNPDQIGNPVNVSQAAQYQGQLDPDPDSSFAGVDLQIFGGNTSPERAPNMQGFVKSYLLKSPSHAKYAMYYFSLDELPVLATLATQFAVCDRWFSSVPGPSIPNRAFAHYGTSYGQVGMSVFYPQGKSIYERLQDAGHTARLYYFDQQSSTVEVLNLLQHHPDLFATFDQFLADAKAGKLPDYSFVEPNFTDHESADGAQLASDEHPDHNVQAGELFIAQVYNAIHQNPPLWRSSVLVITYSNHGGIYDHIAPPAAVPDGFTASAGATGTGSAFRFDRYGVRVPAVIISPYIPKGTVDHTVYDHASIPATVSKCGDLA